MGLPENKKLYDSLPLEKKQAAINFLKAKLMDKGKIQLAIAKDPKGWFASYHFNWGMFVRNLLRHAGLNEEYFGIKNLDDIYVELVEDTVR